VGAQVVDAAAGPGCLQRPGHRRNAGHGRGGFDGGQVGTGQSRRVILAGIQIDSGSALGGLAAVLGAFGIDRDHSAAHGRVKLGIGQVAGLGQDAVLDGAGGLVAERRRGLGDDFGFIEVDHSVGQSRQGPWQPPLQRHGQVGPVGSA